MITIQGPPEAPAVLAASSDGSTLALVWPDASATEAHRRNAVRPFVFGTLLFAIGFVVIGWWNTGLGSTPGTAVLSLAVGLACWFGSERSGFVAWRRILVDRSGLQFDHVCDLPDRLREDVALGPSAGVLATHRVPWEDVPIILANDGTLVVGTAVFVLDGVADPQILADFATQVESARGRRAVGVPGDEQRAALAKLTGQTRLER